MKLLPLYLVLFAALLFCQNGNAQAKKKKKSNAEKLAEGPYAPGPLFESDSLLEFTLTGDLKEIFKDRDAEQVSDHPMLLTYLDGEGNTVRFDVEVKSRGNFRRKRENCAMAPLWIDIRKEAKLAGTVFQKQNKLKLVTPCASDDYVVREYLVYRVYNLLSPQCLKARLVKVTFVDSMQKVKTQSVFCALLEDEDKAARRAGYFLMDKKMVRNESVDTREFTKMALFQYLIANTDWSVPYLHNIKLAFKDSNDIPIAIPYDFDHAGIVDAPYAHPPEQLNLTSVRERTYRGYCMSLNEFKDAIAVFNKLKPDIYQLYNNCPYVDDRYKKNTFRFLDAFYKTINDPKQADRELRAPCFRREVINVGGYGVQ